MGSVNFQSNKVTLNRSAGEVFNFFADLNNLGRIMPEQIINWTSDVASCSFDIKGMAHIKLNKAEALAGRMIRLTGAPENPIDLEFRVMTEQQTENQSVSWIELSADLSPMLKLMAAAPLQNLVNIMASRIQEAVG